MRHILKCPECGKYTMREVCSCGSKTINPKPPKYSPEDPYGKYRRASKEELLKKKGLI
ncbi:RNA-protein complex protein Nop10 [Candidatus Woesearchaeota archaeon]|nr:MAG: RNA-protein complex protein Nop10 [Candidatus Woesearchaeota archaeon]